MYVTPNDNNLYAVSSAGAILWKYVTGGLIYSSPAIGLDGTVHVGSFDGNLHAVK